MLDPLFWYPVIVALELEADRDVATFSLHKKRNHKPFRRMLELLAHIVFAGCRGCGGLSRAISMNIELHEAQITNFDSKPKLKASINLNEYGMVPTSLDRCPTPISGSKYL